MPKTKIIATLGPSSGSPSVLRNMMRAGLDVVRLNFSHGSHQEKARHISVLRELNRKYRRKMLILGDLEGFRIRIGELSRPVELCPGKTLYLSQKGESGGDTVPFDYRGDLRDIHKGHDVFIDDGNLALTVEGHETARLRTRIVVGGLLKKHKGVNIPAARLKFSGMTEKDKGDLEFCREQGVDLVAQSFVRTRRDVLDVRRQLKGCPARVIAKIENREGVRNLGEIMSACDGIMIARGDLGVSLPIYEVPLIQKEMIRKCKRAKKFSITATQMLESMTENHRPTRAEVSDIANAILDGSDYLMLSAETAAGRYPVESVRMMNQIIAFTEGYLKSAKAIRHGALA